jgi:DNA-binding MarR family transcriptional regulator
MADQSDRDVATPTLMRAARGAYAGSIRAQLHAIGIDDLPRNGAFILAGIDSSGGIRQDLPFELGVTKQALSPVIDSLVSRGYLSRVPDPGDRSRNSLELTDRGQRAVDAVLQGVAAVDRQLHERMPAEQIEAMRATLLALAQIKTSGIETGAGRRRQGRQFRRIAPIFGVRDLAAALAHYSALGFTTSADDGGDHYGFAHRDHLGLHLDTIHDHAGEHEHEHHAHPAAAYLYVDDADALYQEWTRPGIGGRTTPVSPMPYGLREGSHTDPDGNLIRFGSPIGE